MAGQRVLVVGAGVAGVTVASALHARRCEVDLIERVDAAPRSRTGLFLPANGVRALTELGFAAALEAGRTIRGQQVRAVGYDGVGTADLEQVWSTVGRSVAIARDRLVDGLVHRAPVPVRRGRALVDLVAHDDHVWVVTDDGREENYDLLVAADGVHSTVRTLLWPDVAARYGGESWWRGVVVTPPGLEHWSASFTGEGSFLAIPLGSGETYWAAGVYTAAPFPDPVEGRAARIRRRFGDVSGVHRAVLDQVRHDLLVQFSPAETLWLEQPVRGRVVVIGDAAHATAPSMAQGAAMAAEDALVLGAELDAQPTLDSALAAFTARRAPRVRHVQQATEQRNRAAALTLDERGRILIPGWAGSVSDAAASLLAPP